MRLLGRLLWGSGVLAGFYLTAKIFFLGEEDGRQPEDCETASPEKNVFSAADPSPAKEELPGQRRSLTFAECAARVRELKREEKHAQALGLLGEYLTAVEKAASEDGRSGIAVWPYEQMAIIYRKDNRPGEEVQILERYETQARTLGVTPSGQLMARLARARALQTG